MININKCHCPSSEDFFYWPPEEIAHYNNWCEIRQLQHRRRLLSVAEDKKIVIIKHSHK